VATEALTISIHDNELLLRKVQEELKKNPEYAGRRPANNIPSIDQVQKTLDRNTAIVFFHLSEKGLLAFVITDHKFDFVLSPIAPGFSVAVDSFKNSLHNIAMGDVYFISMLPVQLYNTLIAPIRTILAKSTRLVIIPGNELSDLPFEALRDKSGKYLIERFAVQYQYSTVLFNGQVIHDHHPDLTRLIIYNAYDRQPGKQAGKMNQAGIFSCAGCPGVITSLWKADSKTTRYITQRLGYYLKKGWSKDKALQKAKTDLLGNAEVDPRFKSPVYWAHLVFAGEYQPLSTLSLWWPLGSSVGVSFLIILLANLDSRRKRFKIRDMY
jgi:CHAT domain-containing protein